MNGGKKHAKPIDIHKRTHIHTYILRGNHNGAIGVGVALPLFQKKRVFIPIHLPTKESFNAEQFFFVFNRLNIKNAIECFQSDAKKKTKFGNKEKRARMTE